MSTMIIFFTISIAVMMFVFFIAVFSAEQESKVRQQTEKTHIIQRLLDQGVEVFEDAELQRYLRDNKKIDAIKRLRTLTQMGLRDAKDTIEVYLADPDAFLEKKTPALVIPDAGVRELVANGRIEEAVEVYRSFTGTDVFSAKEAINKLQRDVQMGEAKAYIERLIRLGDKAGAIEAYQEATGANLSEALKTVEAMMGKGSTAV